ncbi:MAG: hypothetical protein KC503_33895 [Myxococcales bacterium]|nr:hypothetical protein [Myxococcales bacterium]
MFSTYIGRSFFFNRSGGKQVGTGVYSPYKSCVPPGDCQTTDDVFRPMPKTEHTLGYSYIPEAYYEAQRAAPWATTECDTNDFNRKQKAAWWSQCWANAEVRDADGDGYRYPWDCSECNASVYPSPGGPCECAAIQGRSEICGDGKDNDCNGIADVDNQQQPPQPDQPMPIVDVCNGIDDDCDGDVDEDAVLSDSGEICGDGIDNNCDGRVDEGCDCSGRDDCCDKSRGNPINAVTGVMWTHPQVDIKVATGSGTLSFARKYTSQGSDRSHTGLGPGWTHSFDLRVVRLTDDEIAVHLGIWGGVKLRKAAGVYRAIEEGKRTTAEVISGVYRVHLGDGSKIDFDSSGWGIRLTNRFGRGWKVDRDSTGRVTAVTTYEDAFAQSGAGAQLTFAYHTSGPFVGRLQKVTLVNGATREWLYNQSAMSSGVSVLASVVSPTGKTRLYEYESRPTPAPALIRVSDSENGVTVVVEQHHYFGRRAVRSTGPDGDYAFELADATTTRVYSHPYGAGTPCTIGEQDCVGRCSTTNNTTCANDADCPSGETCESLGATTVSFCSAAGTCAGGTGYCFVDETTPTAWAPLGKRGRCYLRRETMAFDALTKRLASKTTTCCGGDTDFAWTAGRISARKRTSTNRYRTFSHDATGRQTLSTRNNTQNTPPTCSSASPDDPCLQTQTQYVASTPLDEEHLVAKRFFTPAIGSVARETEFVFYPGTPRLVESKFERGTTRDVLGNSVQAEYETSYAYYADGRLELVDPPNTPAQYYSTNNTWYYYNPPGSGPGGGLVYKMRRATPGGGVLHLETTFSSYNEFGRPTSIGLPNGVLSGTYAYTADGRLSSIDLGGRVTELQYAAGLLSRIKHPGGGRCTYFTRDSYGRITRTTVAASCPVNPVGAGAYVEYSRDDRGKVIKLTYHEASGTKTFEQRYEYEPTTGKLAKRYDKGSSLDFKQFRYDAFGRLTQFGNESCSGCSGDLIACNCPTVEYKYNGLDQVKEITTYLNGEAPLKTEVVPDAAGNPSIIRSPTTGSTTTDSTYTYDDFGRIVEVTSADGSRTRLEYDGNGNIVKMRRGYDIERETVFDYDGQNRLLRVSPADSVGRCSGAGLATVGQTHKLHYDTHADCDEDDCVNGVGRVVLVETEVGCVAEGVPSWRKTFFSYNKFGQVSRERHAWPDGSENVTEYSYTTDGKVSTITMPLSQEVLTFTHDSASRKVTSAKFLGVGRTVYQNVEYKPFGSVKAYDLGPGGIHITHSWSDGYQLQAIQSSGATAGLDITLVPDTPRRTKSYVRRIGQCVSAADCGNQQTCSAGKCESSHHFTYDYAGRLQCENTSAGCTAATVATQYTGSNISALLFKNAYFPSSDVLSFYYWGYSPYGPNNQPSYVTRFSPNTAGYPIYYFWDEYGARTADWTYPIDTRRERWYYYYPSGRLQALTGRTFHNGSHQDLLAGFAYDHRGRRIEKTIVRGAEVEVWRYFYDQRNRLIAEVRMPSGGTPESFEYVYLGRRPVYQWATSAWGFEYEVFYQTDQLGQPVLGTDPWGYQLYAADVDAFGWTVERGDFLWLIHQPHRRPGQYADIETRIALDAATLTRPALYYNWMRYYDPYIGSYLTADPVLQLSDHNLLRYAYYDPINHVDPTGLSGFAPALPNIGRGIAAAGATLGAIIGSPAVAVVGVIAGIGIVIAGTGQTLTLDEVVGPMQMSNADEAGAEELPKTYVPSPPADDPYLCFNSKAIPGPSGSGDAYRGDCARTWRCEFWCRFDNVKYWKKYEARLKCPEFESWWNLVGNPAGG